MRARRFVAGLLAVGFVIVVAGGGETGAAPIWKKGPGGHGGHGGGSRIERPIGTPIGGYPQTYVVANNGLTVAD